MKLFFSNNDDQHVLEAVPQNSSNAGYLPPIKYQSIQQNISKQYLPKSDLNV